LEVGLARYTVYHHSPDHNLDSAGNQGDGDKVAAPNQALQQTGHAIPASARRHAFFRVSRLLSLLFGEGSED